MSDARQQGAALILAILVVALASSIAIFMAAQQSMWTQQAENLRARGQSKALTHAAIDWTRGILAEDARTTQVDHLGEPWASRLPPLPIESGSLSGAIYDQQALFNLNNLVHNGHDSEADIALFKRLLVLLKLSPDLVAPLLDWIDADSAAHTPGGAEDDYYLQMNPPYRCANRPLLTIEELYRVRGFTRDSIERLRPFVTALPEYSSINVNTAPSAVLTALPEITQKDVLNIVDARKNLTAADQTPAWLFVSGRGWALATKKSKASILRPWWCMTKCMSTSITSISHIHCGGRKGRRGMGARKIKCPFSLPILSTTSKTSPGSLPI